MFEPSKRSVRLVLLVEDNPRLRLSVANLLVADGWDVMAAANGVEALVLLGTRVPDVVLSDVHMPLMDGLTLAARLAELMPELPVVLMSADGDAAHARHAQAFIAKPFEPEALHLLLEELSSKGWHDPCSARHDARSRQANPVGRGQ